MKKIILSLSIMTMAVCSFAQKSQEVDWHQYSIGGSNGYYTKHYFFSQKLNAMLEHSMGRNDGFDGQTMQIDIAEYAFAPAEERYITKYSDKFAVVIFKNITENQADVFYYSDTYDKIEDARAFQPKPEQFSTWYTEKGYALEEAKPVMPELTRDDALEFATFYAAKAKSIMQQMKTVQQKDEQKKMAGLAMAMLLNGVPTEWAVSKGYSGLKSITVIDNGLKKFKDDKEITEIMKSIKFQ